VWQGFKEATASHQQRENMCSRDCISPTCTFNSALQGSGHIHCQGLQTLVGASRRRRVLQADAS
jgi:hypothetical protein